MASSFSPKNKAAKAPRGASPGVARPSPASPGTRTSQQDSSASSSQGLPRKQLTWKVDTADMVSGPSGQPLLEDVGGPRRPHPSILGQQPGPPGSHRGPAFPSSRSQAPNAVLGWMGSVISRGLASVHAGAPRSSSTALEQEEEGDPSQSVSTYPTRTPSLAMPEPTAGLGYLPWARRSEAVSFAEKAMFDRYVQYADGRSDLHFQIDMANPYEGASFFQPMTAQETAAHQNTTFVGVAYQITSLGNLDTRQEEMTLGIELSMFFKIKDVDVAAFREVVGVESRFHDFEGKMPCCRMLSVAEEPEIVSEVVVAVRQCFDRDAELLQINLREDEDQSSCGSDDPDAGRQRQDAETKRQQQHLRCSSHTWDDETVDPPPLAHYVQTYGKYRCKCRQVMDLIHFPMSRQLVRLLFVATQNTFNYIFVPWSYMLPFYELVEVKEKDAPAPAAGSRSGSASGSATASATKSERYKNAALPGMHKGKTDTFAGSPSAEAGGGAAASGPAAPTVLAVTTRMKKQMKTEGEATSADAVDDLSREDRPSYSFCDDVRVPDLEDPSSGCSAASSLNTQGNLGNVVFQAHELVGRLRKGGKTGGAAAGNDDSTLQPGDTSVSTSEYKRRDSAAASASVYDLLLSSQTQSPGASRAGDGAAPQPVDSYDSVRNNTNIKRYKLVQLRHRPSIFKGRSRMSESWILRSHFLECYPLSWLASMPSGAKYSRFHLVLQMECVPTFYVLNVHFILFCLVALAFSTFLVSPEDVGTRMQVLLTLVLALAAYKVSLNSWMPIKPYVTRLDVYVLLAFAITSAMGADVMLVGGLCSLVSNIGYDIGAGGGGLGGNSTGLVFACSLLELVVWLPALALWVAAHLYGMLGGSGSSSGGAGGSASGLLCFGSSAGGNPTPAEAADVSRRKIRGQTVAGGEDEDPDNLPGVLAAQRRKWSWWWGLAPLMSYPSWADILAIDDVNVRAERDFVETMNQRGFNLQRANVPHADTILGKLERNELRRRSTAGVADYLAGEELNAASRDELQT